MNSEKKERLTEELGVKEKGLEVDLQYVLDEYENKVEPYLPLIHHWKFKEKMKLSDIRLTLGLTFRVWEAIKRMPSVRAYTKHDGKFMQASLQKELVEAKKDNSSNAKFHELTFNRLLGTQDKNSTVGINTPNSININIEEASMDEDDIKESVDEEEEE